ncbi:MAG: hypothetical protein WBM90_12845 [Acidimicrobiia bacterium]
MKRLVSLAMALLLVPATAAAATDLGELLEGSHDASYSAEQIISCSTPDGLRDAVVRIAQDGGDIWIGSSASGDVEVATGEGGWSLLRGGGVVKSALLEAGEDALEALYSVEDLGEAQFLGRPATAHQLVRDGVLRAELVFDDETGALVEATTFLEDGETYCERRFVSFDTTPPNLASVDSATGDGPSVAAVEASILPDSILGFERLDLYEDTDGSTFAYYSDGFFSFAVFETPSTVTLPAAVSVDLGGSVYERSFTAGQATYVWETRTGGMALVGDLPPDLHVAVLASLPASETPGLLRRLWRSLFG